MEKKRKHKKIAPENSLSKLVRMAGKGDHDALEALAEVVWQFLLRDIRRNGVRVLRSEMDSEDLAVEATESAMVKLGNDAFEFRGHASFFAFLKTIVRRKADHHFREHGKISKHLRVFVDTELLEATIASTPGNRDSHDDAGERIDAEENERIAEVFVESLPPEAQRELLTIVKDLEGNLVSEFAKVLELLEKTPQAKKCLLLILNTRKSEKELAIEMNRAVSTIRRYKKEIRTAIKKVFRADDEPE